MIVRGASASVAGLGVRLGARLALLVIAGQLYGAELFGAYALAVAAVELAVAIGGLSMKKLLFQRLDERGERPPGHVLADAILLVASVSLVLAGALAAAILLVPDGLVSANTAWALLALAPMILGQALIDVLLAATRWTHVIRYEVAARSIVEPYAVLAAAALAFYAGNAESGLLIAYWAGTLATLAFALAGARRCLGPVSLRAWRIEPVRLRAMLRGALANTATDALSGLFLRLDLYLVGILLGERTTGIYNMARQLAQPIRQVRQGFDGLLTPLVAEDSAPREPGQGGERDRLGDPADPGAAAADGGCDVRGRLSAARLAGTGIRRRLAGCDPARLRRDRAGCLWHRRPVVRLPAAAARPSDLRRQCRRRLARRLCSDRRLRHERRGGGGSDHLWGSGLASPGGAEGQPRSWQCRSITAWGRSLPAPLAPQSRSPGRPPGRRRWPPGSPSTRSC